MINRLKNIWWTFPAQLYTPILWFKGFSVRRKFSVKDIPEGDYCYTPIKAPCAENNWKYQIKCCPFLDHNPWANDQSYGWCHYIKAGDWQWKGTSLLWDQCKSCGENNDDFMEGRFRVNEH